MGRAGDGFLYEVSGLVLPGGYSGEAGIVEEGMEAGVGVGISLAKCCWTGRTECRGNARSTATIFKPLPREESDPSSRLFLRPGCVKCGPPLPSLSPLMINMGCARNPDTDTSSEHQPRNTQSGHGSQPKFRICPSVPLSLLLCAFCAFLRQFCFRKRIAAKRHKRRKRLCLRRHCGAGSNRVIRLRILGIFGPAASTSKVAGSSVNSFLMVFGVFQPSPSSQSY
jgi:hypothetical protein